MCAWLQITPEAFARTGMGTGPPALESHQRSRGDLQAALTYINVPRRTKAESSHMDDRSSSAWRRVGIGVVVPATDIIFVLEQDALMKRQKDVQQKRDRPRAVLPDKTA
jgi:hypothetical protein